MNLFCWSGGRADAHGRDAAVQCTVYSVLSCERPTGRRTWDGLELGETSERHWPGERRRTTGGGDEVVVQRR